MGVFFFVFYLLSATNPANASSLPGFQCKTFPEFKNQLCVGKIQNYSQEVAIVLPHQSPQTNDRWIFHFHGHRAYRPHLGGRLETFADLLKEFRFEKLQFESGRNELWIIPSSLGMEENFIKELTAPHQWNPFLKQINQLLPVDRQTRHLESLKITLTGHSGAYEPIKQVLVHSGEQIDEVHLMDALYAYAQDFFNFMNGRTDRNLVTVYRIGTKTDTGSYRLWSFFNANLFGRNAAFADGLQDGQYSYPAFITDTHRRFYNESLNPNPATWGNNPRLQQPVIWIASDVDHYETVMKYLPITLKLKKLD